MKRKFIIFLAAALVIAMLPIPALAAGFNVPELAGITIAGNEAMTRRVSTQNKTAVAMVENLLNTAADPGTRPENTNFVANLTLELPSGNTIVYRIHNDGKGNMYAEEGPRFFRIDAAAFERLMGGFSKFYIYRPMPFLTLKGAGDEAVHTVITQATYHFKKLDGRLYTPGFRQPDRPDALDASKPWPSLAFTGSAASPSSANVRIISESQVVFTGSWNQAGEFMRRSPGRYLVEVTVEFSHDLYGGSVTYQFLTR
ncbi:MAG: hypothetical protein FWH02_05200 [Oscillospiraceae bacterium]|nr:hypothetical protein [Oscillospiraceae bacterium]